MRVLIVADRNASITAMKRPLEKSGFFVAVASDRKDVLRQALQPGWRVVVLDLHWSKDDPLALLQSLRRGGTAPHVLALIDDRDTTHTVRALDLGADDVLAGPIESEEFLARVRALSRRGDPPVSHVIRLHDLEIDRQSHTVKRGGRTISLTPREFALLEILAEHPGRVVNRSTIWQHIYATDERNSSNVVDVYIRYLRNKIDRGFDRPLILTRWGQGYLLRAESNGH